VVFVFRCDVVYGIRPYKRSLFGSTNSRFHKCNAVNSLRLTRRHKVSRESTHQKIHRTFKVRFFFGFYTVRAVRRKHI